MKIKMPYRSVLAVKNALAQSRQFTLAEKMQAGEVLDAMRAAALLHFDVKAPDKFPKAEPYVDAFGAHHDKDSAGVASLKLRGLYEIVRYLVENPDEETDFVVALLDEAARDFSRSPTHRKGVPPQVAAARAARANMSEAEKTEARLLALEGGAVVNPGGPSSLDAPVLESLLARLASLETGAAFVAERLDALDESVKLLEDAQTAPEGAKEKDA